MVEVLRRILKHFSLKMALETSQVVSLVEVKQGMKVKNSNCHLYLVNYVPFHCLGKLKRIKLFTNVLTWSLRALPQQAAYINRTWLKNAQASVKMEDIAQMENANVVKVSQANFVRKKVSHYN